MARVETDFEETRRCLFNSYHSYVQNHVGYLIVIGVGFLSLVSTNQYLFKINYGNIVIILAAFIFGIVDFLRIEYWTWYANVAIILPEKAAIKFFYEYPPEKKYDYSEEELPPNTAILQLATSSFLWDKVNKTKSQRSRIWMKAVLRSDSAEFIGFCKTTSKDMVKKIKTVRLRRG